ncbi:MAG TPA: hypothetical protein VGI69_12040 [Gaiellaceae bacterium]
MNQEIQLISDGDGLAVIGDSTAVERFLATEELPSEELELHRIKAALSTGAAAAQVGSEIAANSGRWVKLTAESAQKVKKYGLTPTKTPGVEHAMIGKPGEVKSWLQITTKPGAMLTNPAMLAGVAGIMSQLAMQQQMAEITAYLATIDAKLDDVLRAQKDTVLAQTIGVGLQIDEAMTIRDHVGRVNDVTWSKIQATSGTIADTQAYALLQLDALADKLEHKQDVGELAKATKDAERTAREWLAVLARCFQLQDAISVLELDRVLETAPDDLDGHRIGLQAARQRRLDAISYTTGQLMARLEAAAGTANTKVLMHPTKSRAVVESSNHVGASVTAFQARLGIEQERTPLEARRWTDAAISAKDAALETGSEGIDTARRLSGDARDTAVGLGTEGVGVAKRLANDTGDAARSATDRLSGKVAKRIRRKSDPGS